MLDLTRCDICPNECGINRFKTRGKCLAGVKPRAALASLHFFEEPCISGSKGSGTIFFSGCGMRCVYCQNHEISSGLKGEDISVEELSEIFKQLELLGADNINLVSPSHFAPQIIEALELYKPRVPVIYNTNGYEKPGTLAVLDKYIDIYLTDFKYADSDVAAELSGCPNYPVTAIGAIEKMLETKGGRLFGADGILKRGVIIRHLIIPSFLDNSLRAIEIMAERFKDKAIISLMSQYTPLKELELPEKINRPLKPLEYKIVLKRAEALGFKDIYIQDLDSVSAGYIPQFNFKGIPRHT